MSNPETAPAKGNLLLEEAQASIFKNKNFLLLWGAALLSSFGISFFLFSQSWYVVQVLNLEASLGLIFIASSIPRLLFMVISGTIADRYSKTKIMFISDFSRSVLLIGLVAWFFFGEITLWTFVVIAFFFGILDAFFWAASGAILPTIIKSENLTRGNSIIQMTSQSSFIVAPMIAGLIIAFGNYEVVFGTTAVMLFIASILISFMKVSKASAKNETEGQSFWETFKEGISYVKNSRLLTLVILTTVFMNLFIVGPMTMGLPLFVKNILQGDALAFSLLEAGLAVGMLVGSIVVAVLNLSRKRGLIGLTLLIIGGMLFIGVSFTTQLWVSMIILGLFGACLSGSNIPTVSAIQSVIEEKVLGRVMGLISLASMGLIPVSFAITSFVLSLGISIHIIMAVGAALVVVYSTFVLISFKELRELN
ncbi:MFS transporter [Lottiidibacillus patelloidae]|uniref:MFS transporter n=1 Tax=Lottiidibacillus patelloidae TaxID=2670334 RepID=A0A263BSX0_9BACI|nr:MFS transporter [Lottiidibacillus patelloidae]OZM56672.1 MFS transporter [Lottiidibacillus patelloidae]